MQGRGPREASSCITSHESSGGHVNWRRLMMSTSRPPPRRSFSEGNGRVAPAEERNPGPFPVVAAGWFLLGKQRTILGPVGNVITMAGRSVIDFSGMDGCLSSLKSCQSFISTGMDIATSVALDLVENHNNMEEVNEMEKVMWNYAAMNREVSHYVEAVEATVNQLKRERPETMPDLKRDVEEKFQVLESTNSDLDLQRNEKFVLFKENLKQMKAKCGIQVDPEEMPPLEQLDEDIAVTQSQTNFICPITQEDMKRPVKNKICGHVYEESAIMELIRNREQRKKKTWCPKVGCIHQEVKKSDLVPDEVLKRTIDSQSKHGWSTQ